MMMKPTLFLMMLLTLPLAGAEPDLKTLLEQGLVAEEVNGDLEAAATAYQKLVTAGEAQQRLLATGLFRLAEVRRKQGKSEEAVTLLQRLLTDHPAQKELVERASEILRTLGVTPAKATSDLALATLDVEEAKEIARMERLLQESPDRAKKEFPLHLAAEKGWLELARRMIERGFDVNQVQSVSEDFFGVVRRRTKTPLAVAAQFGHNNMCGLLIDAKADLNEGGSEADSPVRMAVEQQNVAVLKMLLEEGALPEASVPVGWSTNDGRYQVTILGTALHCACQLKSLEMANLLLKAGVDVESKTRILVHPPVAPGEQTPLFYAIGTPEIMEALLEAGASLDAVNEMGRTVLYSTSYEDDPTQAGEKVTRDTISDFIRAGANVNVKDHDGKTPLLHFASRTTGLNSTNWTMLRKLVTHGADPKVVDAQGNGLLHHIAMNQGVVTDAAVEWLLGLQLDAQVKNNDGKTALDLALVFKRQNPFFTACLLSETVTPEDGLWWCTSDLPLRRIYTSLSANEPLPDLAEALLLVNSLAGWQELKQKRLLKPEPVKSGTESVRRRPLIPSPVPQDPTADLLITLFGAPSPRKELGGMIRINVENMHLAGSEQLKNGGVLYFPVPVEKNRWMLVSESNVVATIDVQHGEVKRAFDLRPDRTSGPISDSDSGLQYAHYGEVILGAADALKAWAPMPGRKAKLTRQIEGEAVELILDIESDDPSNWPRPLTGDVIELLPQHE
jgi:ankyrin repeat protein